MPRNYIVRLTMDRQHEAMIIRRKTLTNEPIDKLLTTAGKSPILGGCVFRPFHS